MPGESSSHCNPKGPFWLLFLSKEWVSTYEKFSWQLPKKKKENTSYSVTSPSWVSSGSSWIKVNKHHWSELRKWHRATTHLKGKKKQDLTVEFDSWSWSRRWVGRCSWNQKLASLWTPQSPKVMSLPPLIGSARPNVSPRTQMPIFFVPCQQQRPKPHISTPIPQSMWLLQVKRGAGTGYRPPWECWLGTIHAQKNGPFQQSLFVSPQGLGDAVPGQNDSLAPGTLIHPSQQLQQRSHPLAPGQCQFYIGSLRKATRIGFYM